MRSGMDTKEVAPRSLSEDAGARRLSSVKRMAMYGTVVVACHALVGLAHGAAHSQLHIGLSPRQAWFVLLVVWVCPLVATVMLWTSRRGSGFTLLALSMAGSLLFGLYHHFVAKGPDHVGHQMAGSWATTFAFTAYGLSACRSSWGLHGITRSG